MNEYDVEFINLLRNLFSNENSFEIQQISKKDTNSFINLNIQNDGINSKTNSCFKNKSKEEKSYIISLLSSEYPNSLLSECRLLDIESQNLKSTSQKVTLENSSKVLMKSKNTTIEIKQKFHEFEISTNNLICEQYPLISESVYSYKTLVSQNLEIFKKLTLLNEILPIIVEFIELPNLIENLISSNMMDDALDALEYGESSIKLLEASIFSINNGSSKNKEDSSIILLIKTIKNRLKIAKNLFYSTLKFKLNSDQPSMINTIELIGQLRLIQLHDNEFTLDKNQINKLNNFEENYSHQNIDKIDTDYTLAKIFLTARSEFIDIEYIKKSQTLLKVSRCASLKSAISLFKIQLVTVISTFNSLFSTDNTNLNLSTCWLNNYIEWFIKLCKNSLTLIENNQYKMFSNSIINNYTEKLSILTSINPKTAYIALFNLDDIPITSSICQELYLQIYDTFSFSKPISFIILTLFENYMIEYYRKMLEFCLESFALELKIFDWKKELKQSYLKINNIRPLAVLYNEFTNTINELKNCSFSSIKYFIIDLTIEFLCISSSQIEIIKTNILENNTIKQIDSEIDNIKKNFTNFTILFNSDIISYVISSISLIFDLDKSSLNKQFEQVKNYKNNK